MDRDTEAKHASELRARAEKIVAASPVDVSYLTPEEIREVVHELQTHQIELEMQNEELRTTQQDLVDARDRYADLYEFAPVGYATISDKGLILAANRALADLLGVEKPALIKQPLSTFILSEDQDVYYKHLRQLKETHQRQICEVRMGDAENCRTLWIRSELGRGQGPDEAPQFWFAFVDVTELRAAEDERTRLERQVQHAQKLESLGVLAGGIAHDFNNLLMGIMGNADLALMELSSVAPVRQNVVDIKKACATAADLCRQMLAYSGMGRFIVEPIDLNHVVEEMGHLLHMAISKKVVLRNKLGTDIPAIDADTAQIHQVLINLVTNASEAIGDQEGVITITTDAVDADAIDLADGLPGGRYVSLAVSDTGCGMDEDTRGKLFEPFFTTKFTGRGLGLAAIQGIMRSHGGTIEVHTQVGKGTVFYLMFPASENAPRAAMEDDADHVADRWQGAGTVLLVDDEECIRTAVRDMLERDGFTVLDAANGRSAIEVFREHVDEICVVLLDMAMPHMSGEEAFQKLREISPGVQVILSSGYTEEDVAARFVGMGLAGFLHKPYTHSHLIAKLQDVLESE